MFEFKHWHYKHSTTDGWAFRVKFWRIQVSAMLMRHAYGVGSTDRWVLQPGLVYDRSRVRRRAVPNPESSPQ